MTTIVNNPSPVKENGDSRGGGFLVGIVLIVIFLGALFYFVLPAIRNSEPIQVNVPAPEITVETPKIVVPVTPETTPTE